MMNDLISLLEGRKKLTLGYLTGGIDDRNEKLVESNDKIFIHQLALIIKQNNQWLKALFIILISLIIFISIIIWNVRDQKTYVIALLGGGQGIGVAAIIARLTSLYNKKRTSELLLFLYQSAETEKEKQKILGELIGFLKKS